MVLRGLGLMILLDEYVRGIAAQELEKLCEELLNTRQFYTGLEVEKLRQELREAGLLSEEERDNGDETRG